MTAVFGVGPVGEALRAGRRRVHRVWLLEGGGGEPRRDAIRKLAAAAGVEVRRARREELDRRTGGGVHQGVLAEADPLPVVPLAQAVAAAGTRPALVVALDGVQDPHNLGAVLRSAECAGAVAVVVPRDRAAALTPAAVKVAEGAAEHVPVVAVTNLARALDELKQLGLWVVGLDAGAGRRWDEADFKVPTAVVLGSEGEGLRRLVRETCDTVVALPLQGRLASLNVSAAAAAVLFEAVRQRTGGSSGAGGREGGQPLARGRGR